MLRRLTTRLLWSVFTIWAVLTLTFAIFNWLPGDPARVLAGPQARPADVQVIRDQLGLDQPVTTQYARFLGRLLRFGGSAEQHPNAAFWGPVGLDLGESYLKRQPVVSLIGKALGPTLLVGILALAIQVALGVLFGVMAAYWKHTVFDWGAVLLTLLGISAPTFLTGLLLQHLFARTLGWFPLDGYGESQLEILRSAFLPSLTLGLYGAAFYTRLVRDEMLTLLQSDFVRTARAKGLSERQVVFKHTLRNALVPLVTVIGMNVGSLVGGAIVTERIFRWPGIGTLTVNAIFDRDGPVVVAVVLLFSVAVVVSNLLVDASYVALDPRVRR
ncbi:MAG: ABC transporter permease [Polyangiaceae bacterium]|nr:ABC transporter permease [Polyangiaceae bacterium]MCW5791536.1 ABC transporter permease [Polyangiaceae bacterium]